MRTWLVKEERNWARTPAGKPLSPAYKIIGDDVMDQELLIERKVGEESSRTYKHKIESGFFDRYMSGNGLDIGYKGYIGGIDPILPDAIGVDLDYPGYDGKTLPFDNNSFDYVYSSHTLEHIEDYKNAIQDWYRVVKEDGHVIISVPSAYTYEKKYTLPSRWNADHKRFYGPAHLLAEVAEALEPNSYRIMSYEEHYPATLEDLSTPDKHSNGPYEYELVIKKVKAPKWEIK